MKAVVVGAGTAGLVAAWELLRNGFEVEVVERTSAVGGLARTFRYGDYSFDIGPHRFFTNDKEVLALVEDVLGDERVEIDRRSGVYLGGRYYDWPLDTGAVFKLPLGLMLRAFRDLLSQRTGEIRTFEDYVIAKYGETLYEVFFRDYSTKFLGIPPEETDPEWARAGIDRAVIDERVKAETLGALVRRTLLPRRVKTTFLYPKGGSGRFCEKLAERFVAKGGQLRLGTEIESVERDGKRLVSVDGRKADLLVWTGSVGRLCELLGCTRPSLDYLSLLLYNIEIPAAPDRRLADLDYQWCYYGEARFAFNRISRPKLFWDGAVPPGADSLCVEVTAMEGDERWSAPEALLPRVLEELTSLRLLAPSHPHSVHTERVREAYPIYRLGFRRELDAALAAISEYGRVYAAGRTGLFWYNNMDHSIRQALDLARKILSDVANPGIQARR